MLVEVVSTPLRRDRHGRRRDAGGKPDPEVYELAAARLGIPARPAIASRIRRSASSPRGEAGMRADRRHHAHSEAEILQAGAESVIGRFQDIEWQSLASR